MELSHALRVESFRMLPFAGRRKCRKLARFAGRCSRLLPRRLWRARQQTPPMQRVAVEDMAVVAAAAFIVVVAAASTAAVVAFMVEVVDSTVAASMLEVSTAAASASAAFMAAHFTAVAFMVAALMPFARLREQHTVTAHVTSKRALKAALLAPAMHGFRKAQLLAVAPPQAARFSAMRER